MDTAYVKQNLPMWRLSHEMDIVFNQHILKIFQIKVVKVTLGHPVCLVWKALT